MMLAARLGLEKGYTNFEIYGGLGGRLDHTLANIQTLTFLNRHNAVGTLIGDDYALKVVTNGVITFGKDLPENARLYIETLERLLDCDIQFISTGAERNEYMIKGEWL